MSSKKNDRPPMHGKRRVYGPANEKQKAWQGGYGYTAALVAKFRRDNAAKEQALLEARECEADVIQGIL